jgi:hypothetical protein
MLVPLCAMTRTQLAQAAHDEKEVSDLHFGNPCRSFNPQ